jgi:DNA topoisomerase-1
MSKLVIVESPTKTKSIKSYLGDGFIVESSKGHVRDLAIKGKGGLGLDLEKKCTPIYSIIKGKNDIVKHLKKLAKDAEMIYLATDPDREGEAISWHLAEEIGYPEKTKRVIFHEITKPAIIDAFNHTKDIDLDLVSSQETRRIVDRIIGFKLSKLLMKKLKEKSAGRVQSAALLVIVNREREIEAFVPEEYWTLDVDFNTFKAHLSKYKNKKIDIKSEEEMNQVLNRLADEFVIKDVNQKVKNRHSKPPFITSTLQQTASTRFGFSPSRTMTIAASLYEGVEINKRNYNLITYPRTDSYRLSPVFLATAYDYIEKTYGKEYVGKVTGKNKDNAQDAHEAIRPTDVLMTPKRFKELTKGQKKYQDLVKLYDLIYSRAVASIMASAQLHATSLKIENNDYIFSANAQQMKFKGYLEVYGEYESVEETTLPTLTKDTTLKASKLETEQHFTTPPPRYTEASLIKTLEELGIGRPSTYAAIIQTIRKRSYAELIEKKFKPTESGVLVTDRLQEFFSNIINLEYTANMESMLDQISEGQLDGSQTVCDFYEFFTPIVQDAETKMDKIPDLETGELCPQCGSKMVYKKGKYGKFEACSNFPTCKYIKKDKKEAPVSTGIKCPKCGKGEFVIRTATRGKSKGEQFYSCNNFPKCKNILLGKPTGDHCNLCGDVLVELNDGQIVCNSYKSHNEQKD